jgi:catechol 1,2-dioxygenase
MGAHEPTRELFSEERSAEVVTASFADTPDPRLRQVMTSLVRHLHAFVKDVDLTEEEWGVAIDFLTRTGQMCSDTRQEFILLSDVLGVSMPVETINHRTGGTSTESTVLGPFHSLQSPQQELGDDINLDRKGTPCLVSGQVTGPDDEPLAGATVDVWQTNEDGFYDVQQPDVQPLGNLRGLFTGSKVRLTATLTDAEEVKGGYQLTVAAVIERQGGDKPDCIAEPVFRFHG